MTFDDNVVMQVHMITQNDIRAHDTIRSDVYIEAYLRARIDNGRGVNQVDLYKPFDQSYGALRKELV